jgi:hypothetical protein
MKVFLFFMLVFVFIFSSCNRNKSEIGDKMFAENQKDSISFSNSVNPLELVDSSFDYSKILNGDLSDFTGYWTNSTYDHLRSRELRSDGTFSDGARAVNFKVSENGTYTWSVYAEDGGGFFVELYPVGIEVIGYSGDIVPSNTTKVRFHSGHEPPFDSGQIYYKSLDDFIILANGAMADIRISQSVVDLIFKHFEAIENGDLAAFRSTLKSPDDAADMYYQINLIYKYFWDFFDLDAAGFNYAIANAEGLEPIINTAFSGVFPLRSRNNGLFIKKMEIVTDHNFRSEGYNELIKVAVTNNKNNENIYYLDIVPGETYERINKHFE